MDIAQIIILDFHENEISMEQYIKLKAHIKTEFPKVKFLQLENDDK